MTFISICTDRTTIRLTNTKTDPLALPLLVLLGQWISKDQLSGFWISTQFCTLTLQGTYQSVTTFCHPYWSYGMAKWVELDRPVRLIRYFWRVDLFCHLYLQWKGADNRKFAIITWLTNEACKIVLFLDKFKIIFFRKTKLATKIQ